jgi:hypothetical protein
MSIQMSTSSSEVQVQSPKTGVVAAAAQEAGTAGTTTGVSVQSLTVPLLPLAATTTRLRVTHETLGPSPELEPPSK